jgi:hypothetical protein
MLADPVAQTGLDRIKPLIENTDRGLGFPIQDPPAHCGASLDEQSQIRALDRTQPGLAIKPGRCQT